MNVVVLNMDKKLTEAVGLFTATAVIAYCKDHPEMPLQGAKMLVCAELLLLGAVGFVDAQARDGRDLEAVKQEAIDFLARIGLGFKPEDN